MLRTLTLSAVLATVATAALAQPVYVERQVVYGPGYGAPPPYARVYGPPPAMCQRWCPEDASPCDPVQFKIADGRCRPALFYR